MAPSYRIIFVNGGAKMQKFLVEFKGLKKQYQIDSQDEATAKKWADRQLEVWKRESKYSVTQIAAKSPEKKGDSAIINPKKKN
jgi:hypothetical protein